MTLFAFLFLGASFLSLWIRRDPKIWGSLLGASLICGFVGGNIQGLGLVFISTLAALWILYFRRPGPLFFLLLVGLSALFKMRLLPGYTPFIFTPKFAVGLEGSLIGLFPLALIVPLARTNKEWAATFKGLFWGCLGIALMAIAATLMGTVHWNFKIPSFALARFSSNLFLTSIPEEGFYRGFIQNTFCKYFQALRFGKIAALFATSLLFTAAHLYWSPGIEVLAFVFLASLLYGGVYLLSGKIESAILSHFLLNLVHMTFFSYHAM